MLRFFILAILLSLTANLYSQEPLPKGMTEAERLDWDKFIKSLSTNKGTAPPSQTPRTPAEWEEAQGVIITWAAYQHNLREIVRHAKEHVKVYIVCSSPSDVESYLAQGGVNTNNVEFVVAPYNSVWVRDFGPQSIYLHETNELAFVDWVYNRPHRPDDNNIPTAIANHLDLPIFQMTSSPNQLVATGGNFMTDGFNQGFSSNLILDENSSLTEGEVDNIKYSYMGIDPYIKMTTLPYDDIHHIDMHMKLLDEETLLVGQYPEGVSDGPQIEENLNYILDNYETPYGRPYKVVRIPMPPDEYGNYPEDYSDYLTYTNAVILNGLVLVPIYGLPQDDEALDIYREAMPGYEVVGINMRDVIPASGAIHCITREIAAHDPIFISHAPYSEEVNYSTNGYTVTADITSASGISEANLYWSIDTTAGFNRIEMQQVETDNYKATIPSLPINSTAYYYISATNANNKTIAKPLVAPNGLYKFELNQTSSSTNYLNVTTNGEGTTSFYGNNYEFVEGTLLTLNATPDEGWEFEKWTVNSTEYNTNEIQTTIDEDLTATAYFTEITSSIVTSEYNSIKLYPNPSSNRISIAATKKMEGAKLAVYNVSGAIVFKEEVRGSDDDYEINISSLPNGIYSLKVISELGVWTGKFVKQ
ncbi:MAG: agmatine deiminase family protein [Bacteroidales bacterium]